MDGVDEVELGDRMAKAPHSEVGPGQEKWCLQEAGGKQSSGQGQALLGGGAVLQGVSEWAWALSQGT